MTVERYTLDTFKKGDKLIYKTSRHKNLMEVVDIVGPNYNDMLLLICEFICKYEGSINFDKHVAKNLTDIFKDNSFT